ncbi:MAG TPA: AI-2E family transporter, partial [Terriglobales bacterium]
MRALFRKVPEPVQVVQPAQDPEEIAEQEEALRTSLQAASIAQFVIATAVVLSIVYIAKLPLVVICVSMLLAFILEPLVKILQRIRFPRSLAAIVSILLFCVVLYGLTYFFYQRATQFAHELPRYSTRIRARITHYRKQTEELQRSTQQVIESTEAPTSGQKPVPVAVKSTNTGVTGWIQDNFGTVSEIVLTTTFIPFLTYFMLTWQDHVRRATVKLFADEHQRAAYRTLGKMSDMMRGFVLGNFYIGLFISGCSILVFGLLGLPYFYFTGLLSGFLSVVPYLGVLLAIVPPVATGLGHLTATKVVIVVLTVLGLHLFALNVLYPKVLGKRLQLNPLVVTLALLIWGWIWGAMGLILA